ncbi:hypothetical protein [Serratia sp. (in: enterobacteria)]|uniref:hypothetical protein n=1 Tax=Serratia sp. (in: enterobacteria) TaxID=616 RepID=UPI0039892C80
MVEFACKNCGQWVEVVEKKKGIFGKSRIEVERKLYNYLSGKGGKKGQKHDCPNKYDRPFPCKLCQQEIYISSTKKYENGKNMVLNYRTSMLKGGMQDEKHVCPYRLFSEFHRVQKAVYNPMRYCLWCASYWNEQELINCPNCWVRRCRDCGHETRPVAYPPGWTTSLYKKEWYDKIKDEMTYYNETVINYSCENCGTTKSHDYMRVYK